MDKTNGYGCNRTHIKIQNGAINIVGQKDMESGV